MTTRSTFTGKKKTGCFYMNSLIEETVLEERVKFPNLRKFGRLLKRELPFAFGSPAVIWQILFFYLPLLIMLFTSFFTVSETGALSVSTTHFARVFKFAYLKVIASSLSLSFTTGILCFLIAFPLAHFITFSGGRYKTILLFLLIVPFWTNFLLHIYAWFFVLEKEGFLNTILMNLHLIQKPIHFLNTPFAVMLMMVYYYLPFMTLPIYSALDKLDTSLFEASSDLGASTFQTFRRILLPLSLSSIRTGFFLVFIPAFGEFVIPELMGGDKTYYVGSVISQFILGQTTGQMGTAFTVLAISALSICIFLCHLVFEKISKLLSRGVL